MKVTLLYHGTLSIVKISVDDCEQTSTRHRHRFLSQVVLHLAVKSSEKVFLLFTEVTVCCYSTSEKVKADCALMLYLGSHSQNMKLLLYHLLWVSIAFLHVILSSYIFILNIASSVHSMFLVNSTSFSCIIRCYSQNFIYLDHCSHGI